MFANLTTSPKEPLKSRALSDDADKNRPEAFFLSAKDWDWHGSIEKKSEIQGHPTFFAGGLLRNR